MPLCIRIRSILLMDSKFPADTPTDGGANEDECNEAKNLETVPSHTENCARFWPRCTVYTVLSL
jgi:hypothetical protein